MKRFAGQAGTMAESVKKSKHFRTMVAGRGGVYFRPGAKTEIPA
jgi:hypothetical protein